MRTFDLGLPRGDPVVLIEMDCTCLRLGGRFNGIIDCDTLKWSLGMIRTFRIDGHTSIDCYVMDGLSNI